MSGFERLKEISEKLEQSLRLDSSEFLSARTAESFENGVTNKLCDLSLYSAKLKLLRAKPISLTPQVASIAHEEDVTLSGYEDAAGTRVLEQLVVKSVTQSNAVKKLLTTPDEVLDDEMRERKHKIITSLLEHTTQETKVVALDKLLQEKEARLAELRLKWDAEMLKLRNLRLKRNQEDVDKDDPLFLKLKMLVDKLEIMRWLITKLAMPRARGYDWLTDPHGRVAAIKMARKQHTIQDFMDDNIESGCSFSE